VKRRTRVIGGIVLAVIVIGAVALWLLLGGPGRRAAVVAKIVEVINRVDAHPRPADDWQPAAVNMGLYGGGQVRTGAESRARLEMPEGAVRLSADTVFTVKESVVRQGKLLTTVSLQEGRLWANVTTGRPHEFTVEAGGAVAAVRDTRFCVQVAGGETLVSVAEGQVELTAQQQTVTVAAGQQARVQVDRPPAQPMPLSDTERKLWATEGEMPEMALPTPTPSRGRMDMAMGGSLTLQGVVRDDSGRAAPNVYVTLTVYEAGGGWDWGQLWNGETFTDQAGGYAFANLLIPEGGHYEVWFNGRQEYGKVYENSGYYVNDTEIGGDTYTLNVTVHPVTGSALSAAIQYQDANGNIRNYLDTPLGPDHFVALSRGTEAGREYAIGFEYLTHDGSRIYLSGLAGGTYYLDIQYKKPDGTKVSTSSPPFEIPAGQTRQFDYTIP